MVELSLAPMLKVTSPQFRLLMRKISKEVVLFTEMIVSTTVVHVSVEKLQTMLGQPDSRTIVQIGGSKPEEVAKAVERLLTMGWQQFNLNCGCPSDRVQSGRFGAILMRDSSEVIAIINEVYKQTGVVLSLKIRTGVDELDSYEFLSGFVKAIVNNTPCCRFYVHARKCWLKGVSPKQNRTIPPLNYKYVYDLKAEMPDIFLSLNGGIKDNGLDVLGNLDGLMIGRYAVDNIKVFRYYEEILRTRELTAGVSTNNMESKKDGTGDIENKSILSNIMLRDAVQSYLSEAVGFFCSKARIMLPLNNIRKGMAGNKEFRAMLAEIIRDDCTLEQAFYKIEKYVE